VGAGAVFGVSIKSENTQAVGDFLKVHKEKITNTLLMGLRNIRHVLKILFNVQ
jgi:hypothetical protein